MRDGNPMKAVYADLRKVHEWTGLLLQKVFETFQPDCVVGIERSGTVPSNIIANSLGIPSYSVRIRHYGSGLPPIELYEDPIILRPLRANVEGQRVLVIDDLVRTGRTLQKAVLHLREKGAIEVKTGTLVVKPEGLKKVDFYAVQSEDCVVFPWDVGKQDEFRSELSQTGS
jgi:hypoxanthine phosphoribosyltransferase